MEQNSQELRGTQPTQPVSDENYEDNGSVVYGRLAPLHGKDLEEILLTPEHEKYLVGKDPACNVVLPDLNGISHRHFEVYVGDSSDSPNQTRTIFIEDKSTCGTYVRGKRIGKANKTVLSNGDEITLGGTTPDGSGNKKFLSYIFLQRSAKDDSTEVNDTYDIRDFIGSGNFSIVKQAIHRSTGDQYACKIINMHKWASQPAVLRALEREVEILKRLNHQHIVSFIDFYRDPKTYWIIMEFVSGGDLNGYLGKKPVLEESEVKHLTRQICEAVQYMHEKGFVHRDIKPDNILLTLPDRNFVKLSDLGLAKFVGANETMLKTICGTPAYQAPEAQNKEAQNNSEQEPYSKAVDLWSVGVVVYQMIARKMPFECSTQKALTDAITQGDLDLTPFTAEGGYSDLAKDFVTRLLEVDPKQRMTADEALKHPWLMDVTTTTVDFKIETVQEVSSELPIPLKRELSSDGFWPSLSTGLTHIFESNEFLSAPELTTEAGPSNIDRPQAQPKTRVQKHSSSGSPGSPRRVTRAQSKLQVAESAHITTVTNKKRPAPSTDPESPVHDIDQTPTFPMEIVTSAGVGAVDPLPSQSSTTRIGRTNTLPLDDNMGNDKCNESTMPYYRCTEPVDGITDMDFDYASNSTRVNQSILTENGQSINTEDDDNIKEEDVPWAVLRLVDRSREGTDAGCWADRVTIGRSHSCQVILNDGRVSSKHCTFWKDGDKYFVEDTSGNGVYLGNQRIRKYEAIEIKDGEEVAVIYNNFNQDDFIKYEFKTDLICRRRLAPLSPSMMKTESTDHPEERPTKLRRRTTEEHDPEMSFRLGASQLRPALSSPCDIPTPWGRLLSLNPVYPHVWLIDDTIFIGRQTDCPEILRFKNPHISAHHCMITRKDGVTYVEDMSINGTYLNGERLPPRTMQPLKLGDEIVLLWADPATDVIQRDAADTHKKRFVDIGYSLKF